MEVLKWLDKQGADMYSEDYIRCTAIFDAVTTRDLQSLKFLVNEKHMDVNARDRYGRTVLHRAVSLDNLHAVKWLIEKADADVLAKDCDGRTVLHAAAANGQWSDTANWLVGETKVDVNGKDFMGEAALHIATRGWEPGRSLGMMKVLIEVGKADVGAPDNEGTSVLEVAQRHERSLQVQYLTRFVVT